MKFYVIFYVLVSMSMFAADIYPYKEPYPKLLRRGLRCEKPLINPSDVIISINDKIILLRDKNGVEWVIPKNDSFLEWTAMQLDPAEITNIDEDEGKIEGEDKTVHGTSEFPKVWEIRKPKDRIPYNIGGLPQKNYIPYQRSSFRNPFVGPWSKPGFND